MKTLKNAAETLVVEVIVTGMYAAGAVACLLAVYAYCCWVF